MAVRALCLLCLNTTQTCMKNMGKLHIEVLPPWSYAAAPMAQASKYIKFGCCVRWVDHRLVVIASKWRREVAIKLMS